MKEIINRIKRFKEKLADVMPYYIQMSDILSVMSYHINYY